MSEASLRRPPHPRPKGEPVDPSTARPGTEPNAGNAVADSVASTGRRVLAMVAAVGSPFAAGTALLVYFGWVRTQVQARALGYDAALLDYSVRDYVMRSIVVLYDPVLVLALTALGLQWLHRRWVMGLVRGPRRQVWLPRLISVCAWSTAAWAVMFAGLAFVAPPLAGFCIAGFLTAAVLSTLYTQSLRAWLDKPPHRTRVSKSLLLVILALALFWATEQVAANIGEAYATQVGTDRNRLVAVVVYSAKSLNLTGSGVIETRLMTPDSKYQYRYNGLRLLQWSDKRYFLIGDGWSPQNRRVVLLQDTDDIRVEFTSTDAPTTAAGRRTHRVGARPVRSNDWRRRR
jgi:hypothetical protein